MAEGHFSEQGKPSMAELRLKIEEDQFYLERAYNQEIWRESTDMRREALDWKKAYDELVKSKPVRVWRKVSKLLGKPYKRLRKAVPEGVKGSPFEVHGQNRPLVDTIVELATAIPPSNGSAYFKKADLKIGIITDDFMYHYYRDAATLVELNPINYVSVIDSGELDFVLFVSAWRGLGYFDGIEEPERAYFYGKPGIDRAVEILRYARSKGVRTVFQTIEDPPSYEYFLPVAREADVVFTATKECVEDYKRDLGHDRVHNLLYGVNPLLQNPIGAFGKQRRLPDYLDRTVLFAGAWYPRFVKRCEDTQMLLDGVVEHSNHRLYLADRNLLLPYHVRRSFPSKYDPYLIPPIAHEVLQRAHKLFDFTVNVNTVTDSETMCAMRVYEVQAMGGLLLSNYALSVSSRFPGVFTVHSSEEVGRMLSGYTDAELDAMRLECIRNVYSEHTVYDRLNEVLAAAGMPEAFPTQAVYVVCDDPAFAAEEVLEPVPGMRVVTEAELRELAPEAGFMVRLAEGPERRGRFFLVDMLNAMKFVDVAYVCYVDDTEGAYAFASNAASALDCLFDLSEVPVSAVLDGVLPEGLPGFSVMAPQWGRDTSATPKDIAVVVPVRGDGELLFRRCFRSLLRSSVYARMKVYLLDCGEGNAASLRTVRWMANTFDNVEILSAEQNEPSREWLAANVSEPYAVLLKSEDEVVGDGIARLLEEMKKSGASAPVCVCYESAGE